MASKKKLLMIVGAFYPGTSFGGPTVSITNLSKLLADFYDVKVITKAPNFGNEIIEGRNLHFDGRENLMWGMSVVYLNKSTYNRIKKIADEYNPDIIYASSVFNYRFTIPALMYGKKHTKSIHTLLSTRGELMPNAYSRKKLKKDIYFALLKMSGLLKAVSLHVTSKEEKNAVKQFLPQNKISMIKNPVNIEAAVTRHPYKNVGTLKLISVGRVHSIKNVLLMIKALKECQGNVEYNIYGPIEDQDYYQACLEEISHLDAEKKVSFCGMISNSELRNIYNKSHVYFSLTQTENFGNSIVEALSFSCPSIISHNTPWHFESGELAGECVNIDSIKEPVKALQKFIDMDNEEYSKCVEAAHEWILERMQHDEIKAQYIRMFQGEIVS